MIGNQYPRRLEQAFVRLYSNAIDSLNAKFFKRIRARLSAALQVDADRETENLLEKMESAALVSFAVLFADVKRVANAFDNWNFVKLRTSIPAAAKAAGFSPVKLQRRTPMIQQVIAKFANLNAQLIRDIRLEYTQAVGEALRASVRQNVSQVAAGMITRGEATRRGAKAIREATGAIKTKAKFWARDQSSKLYGQLNRTRQIEAGVPGYIWMTMLDARVRPTHAQIHGQYFTWEKGSSLGGLNPGDDYQCRCDAVPSYSSQQALSNRQQDIAQRIIKTDRRYIKNRERWRSIQRRAKRRRRSMTRKERQKYLESKEKAEKARKRLEKLNEKAIVL